MDERQAFIESLKDGETMAAACRKYGISRPTGYKWLRRYQEKGMEGLLERSRRAWSHPNETPVETVEQVLALRRAHPTWGPRKLLAFLARSDPELLLPSSSTVANILNKHGMVVPRRRRRVCAPTGIGIAEPASPNLVWATDFKGEFRTRDRCKCYPLTIQDTYSRYLLRCASLRTCSSELSIPIFRSAFREFGMPHSILSDNGSPFSSASFSGLTALSAWWVRLGIELVRIQPGHPEQNGRLERLHRTLKADTAKPPSSTLRAQQTRFDKFRCSYNTERPHEALGNRTPTEFYIPSAVEMPRAVAKPQYAQDMLVRRLNRNGEISFRRHRFTVSKAICGEDVAFEESTDGQWKVYYYRLLLGLFDERNGRITRKGFVGKAVRS